MSSRKFLALFLLCALVPLAAAWASLRLGWFAAAPTVNHGGLVSLPRYRRCNSIEEHPVEPGDRALG